MSEQPESDAFQVLYELLAQLEAEQPKRFQTLRVKTAVERLEELWHEGVVAMARCDARVRRVAAERDQYADRLEHEQRDHEVTKGYRAHAEQLLADEQRAHLATKGYLAPERPLDELIAEELAGSMWPKGESKTEPCCWKCTPDWQGMMLCPACGNKRCPAANDCANACTGSNEPGQPGSAYPPIDRDK